MSGNVIEASVVNELRELMGEAFDTLIERFEMQSGQYVKTIAAGIAEGDATKVAGAAHPLKSSSKQMGALKLSDLARTIELEAKEKKAITEVIKTAYQPMPELFQQVCAALKGGPLPTPEGPAPEVLDMKVFNELRELMGDALSMLTERYEAQSAQYIEQIAAGIAERNKEKIAKAAHPLKSSSKQMAAMVVSELARVIELEANEKDFVTDLVKSSYEKLVGEHKTAIAAIKGALQSAAAA